jgi:hypothetical protein
MRKRILLSGILCLSLVVALGSEVLAGKVCVYRDPITGKCKIWSGSVECGISANGLGNVTKDPKACGCTVLGSEGGAAPVYGLVFCGNPGSKTHAAPGIQPCYYDGTFGDFEKIRKGDVDRNGVAYVTAYAALNDLQLASMNGCCPNTDWVAIDFVPIDCDVLFDLVEIVGYDSEGNPIYGEIIDQALYSCTLPDPFTLGWDKKAQKPERREYDCTEVLP